MKLPRQVYGIRHNVTGRIYIGSSANVEKRIYKHMQMLRNGCHHVGDMQADFREYGDNYSVLILDEIRSYQERSKEYCWMKKYKSFIRGVGYNYKDQAKNQLGKNKEKGAQT